MLNAETVGEVSAGLQDCTTVVCLCVKMNGIYKNIVKGKTSLCSSCDSVLGHSHMEVDLVGMVAGLIAAWRSMITDLVFTNNITE